MKSLFSCLKWGIFSNIPKSAEFIQTKGHELLNSLRFNQADWTIVVRKKA